ncbi:MAG: NosD domain-containing protein [Candidatus Thorarchaeota archaeon]
MVRRGVVLLLIIVLGFSLAAQSNLAKNPSKTDLVHTNRIETSYIAHAPFNITSNADFVSLGFPGNGTLTDPYIIDNLNITRSSSVCIWVANTTSHFVIQNCLFISPVFEYTPQYLVFPLTLTNVSNGEVYGNRVVNSNYGIAGAALFNCTLSNNEFIVTSLAIDLRWSNFTSVFNNSQTLNSCYSGIYTSGCWNCSIVENHFENVRQYGLVISTTYNSSIVDNVLLASKPDVAYPWTGIDFWGGGSCRVIGNEISGFLWSGMTANGFDLLLERNNVSGANSGINLLTTNSTVIDNRLINNSLGIDLVNANNTWVHDNLVRGRSGRYETGIAIHGGVGSEIFSNTITHVGQGLILQGARSCNVSHNTVADGRYGFAFVWYSNWANVPHGPANDCDIISNTFDEGGLYPYIDNYNDWNFSTIRFQDNKINGKIIGLFVYLEDTLINGIEYGQLNLVSCTNVTIVGGNFFGVSSDLTDDPYPMTGEAAAITLINCTDCELIDVSFHNNTNGVFFQSSANCRILRGLEYYHSWTAIVIVDSEGIDIVDVYIRNNLKAVRLVQSWDCTIRECLIWRNDEAINLVNSMNCTLSRNRIFENGYGVFLEDADGCELNGNSIYLNSRGILLNSSSDCFIIENHVYNNTGVGILLDASSNRNDIYANEFAYNSPNAICEGSSNHWDDQVDTGNWWSDYSGHGPYIIDSNDQDNFPIVNTTISPSQTSPTSPTSWKLDPVILVSAGVVMGVVVLVIVILDRRRIAVVD